MKIAVLKERREHEKRVAATPETVKKYIAANIDVVVETAAGSGCDIDDAAYKEMGAQIANSPQDAVDGADIILKVSRPLLGEESDGSELDLFSSGQKLISTLDPIRARNGVEKLAELGVEAFALELMPRITRAQSMDVLSSQSNLAGYKAVLDANDYFGRAMPMMMTAAGTIAPAKVFVMGAGVAGLQAIATARRLGAVVSATDVRPVAKEQVESLGATFVMVEDEETADAETAGGYAKEMSAEYQAKQAALISETITKQDIVICTALIPGRPAPTLLTAEHVKSMKPGSVIVDLAVETGGNCELAKAGEVVDANGVIIVGHLNVPSRVAVDASSLYARNIWNFLSPHINEETGSLDLDYEDETVSGILVCRDGKIVHPMLETH